MKGRTVLGLMLSGVLVLLVAGSTLAGGPQATGAESGKPANAPWFVSIVDSGGNTGQYASVAILPSDGRTFVGYYDVTDRELRLASPKAIGGNCGPSDSWDCGTWESGVDVGSSSIAINGQNGAVGFAYHDALNGYLKYRTSGYSTVVDKGTPLQSTGKYASLKYAWNGRPFIAYHFDDPAGVDSLKVAYRKDDGIGNCGYVLDNVSGDWQCDTIHTGEGVGQHASLVLDRDGFLHIAYYDRVSGDLWYATTRGWTKNCGPGNSWYCYPVSTANDVGKYASLYVDKTNRFHIAYYDATSDKLKYAVEVGGGGGNCGPSGSAQCDTIDSMQADYHPVGVSIAEDAAGYPIIAYQSKDGDLNVARPLGALGLLPGEGNCGPEIPHSSWYCETIDPHGERIYYRNGDYVSIAVSPSGLATIAYYRSIFSISSHGNLNVAYQRFQSFLPLVVKNQ